MNGRTEVCLTLLHAGAEPSPDAILLAAALPDTRVLQYLFQHHPELRVAKTDEERNTPLHIATKNQQIQVVDGLLQWAQMQSVDLHSADSSGYTPLMIASSLGWSEGV